MKVYIAGPITGNPNYMEQFAKAEQELRDQGHTPMNPSVLSKGFEQDEYMKICYSMIDACEGVYFLNNWWKSKGAKLEYDYAIQKDKAMVISTGDGTKVPCNYEQKAQKIGAMVDKKNQLYGSSFEKSGEILKILYPDGVKPEQYRNILGTARVIDKLFRVANGNYGDEDAWQDVCGYGLLLGKEVE